MIWQRVSVTLLTSSILALVAVVASPAIRAEDKPAEKKEAIPAPAPAVTSTVTPGGCGAPCEQTWTTIKVTEYQQTTVKEKRTVLKPTTVNETYTAWKTECVEEAQTRTITVNKMVPVTCNVTKTITKCVPTVETRCVTKCVPVCKTVTEMCTKTVDKGHWECKEEVSCPGFFEKAKHKLFHHNDCECSEPCPTVKTKKVWVACPTTECYPVTKTIRSHETITSTVQVTVNKQVCETVVCPVTTYKCVPECKTEVVKVLVPKQVSYQATRCVTKCVPVEEEFTVTKCIPVIVEKKVAVAAPACNTCNTCSTCNECSTSTSLFGGRLSGLFSKCHKHHNTCGCGCE
jgi:hypothetical protein